VARPRLLALRALGLGDLLTAVPALRGLAAAFPGHERLLAAPAALLPLLPLLRAEGEPCVHRLVDLAGLEGRPGALPAEPQLAVNLHGRGPRSHRLLLSGRPRRLLAFHHPEVSESAGMPAWRSDEHEVARWCRLLAELGVEADPGDLAIDRPALPVPAWAENAILIHPGAASAARRWPAERWAAVAAEARAAGAEVLLTGGPDEDGVVDRVGDAAGVPAERRLAGRTDLAELAALVAAAGAVLCGDTGVAHLATALGVPSVVLFGPTSPEHWGPPADRSIHRALWHGRRGDPHAAAVDPGLLEIGTDDVLRELGECERIVVPGALLGKRNDADG
jgi:ADP-heptose:LPS heptosyltransferase